MSSTTTPPSVIDGPLAWRRLFAAVLIGTVGGIGMWTIPVALPAVQAEFAIDRSSASLPYTLTMLGLAAGGILMGRLADQRGIRYPLALGVIGLATGFTAAAFAPTLLAFTIAHGLLIGALGSSAFFAPLVADITCWFQRRRGIAVAICASGNYLAGVIWPPMISYGILNYGWRTTYLVVAAGCAILLPPLLMLLRRPPPPQPALTTSNTGVTANAERPLGLAPNTLIALLTLAGVACCVAMSMPQVHLVAYCGDLGIGAQRGAEMLSLMLVGGVASRLISGLLSDKLGGLASLIIGSTLQALALMLYLPFTSLSGLYVVSALFGLAQGGIVPSYAVIIREHMGSAGTATRISLVLMATVAGMALGGWLSGIIFDLTGSYRLAFVHGAAWNVLNLGIALFLFSRAHPRKSRHVTIAT
ncbi:MAG: MFS transporter [Hyphomicrobiaceae bacterium]